MNVIARLYHSIIGGYRYTKIYDLIMAKRYEEALAIAKSITVRGQLVSRIELIEAELYYYLGQDYKALSSLQRVYNFLEEDDELNAAIKEYLHCYASELFSNTCYQIKKEVSYPKIINREAIELEKVPNTIKQYFPLSVKLGPKGAVESKSPV